MANKTKSIDYRDLKKYLNGAHRFSFKMPRKGKDFTPQQKSAITRKFNELGKLVQKDRSEKITFIQYPKGSKLPHIDGHRTNKGIFYKYAGATAKKIKQGGRKVYAIELNYKDIKGELFIPFPGAIINDPIKIQTWIAAIQKKYKPKRIRMSVNGGRGSQKYDPKQMNYYMAMLIKYQDDKELRRLAKSGRAVSYEMTKNSLGGIPFFNGVFLEF